VHAAATHAVLAAGAAATLGAAPLESIVVTGTVSDVRKRGVLLGAKLCVLEIAPLFSTAIERLLDAGGTVPPPDPD
jgi:phosphoribosylpyrophosphate synthetase